jgi:hypothetical protein
MTPFLYNSCQKAEESAPVNADPVVIIRQAEESAPVNADPVVITRQAEVI